ncbi:hypothetical protein QFC22_000905 [Naganishia vaughanmartiniae]|uniref:Uncharacterized protein n=1 Tax=Naganishia vaughanmartiniae TaxID=1424756 RepID=A0ACC2XL48_9TREE|nr:hypothetical protein QFC22_000905 [Naganishia vaughanmartiniae]
MERTNDVRTGSTYGSTPRTPMSQLKRGGADNGIQQSDLLRLLEDLGTDSPIKPMEDYGLPSSIRPASLAQYDGATARSSTLSREIQLKPGSSPMERRASDSMIAPQSNHGTADGQERETPSPSYPYGRQPSRQHRGPTPPSGSSLSSIKSSYSGMSQRSIDTYGLTDSATLNSLSSIAITPELTTEEGVNTGSGSSRFVPSAGRTFNRTVSAPLQMGRHESTANDEYEELSLTNRKRAEQSRTAGLDSRRDRHVRQPLSQDYVGLPSSSESSSAQDSYKTPALRRRVMDATVQGSTGGKRFAMKAQRPVRDATGSVVSDSSPSAEEVQYRETADSGSAGESSSSRLMSLESNHTRTSPRQRIHAIPSTIPEDSVEEATGNEVRYSSSPRFDSNAQTTVTNNTVRGQGHSGSSSPSNTATLLQAARFISTDHRRAPSPPAQPSTTVGANAPNKENRDPYNALQEGTLELPSADSKTWIQDRLTAEQSYLPTLRSRVTNSVSKHTSIDVLASEDVKISLPEDRDLINESHRASAYQQYNQPPPNGELPLITPTIARSMTAMEQQIPMERQQPIPPFVAYNAYQQAMTPMANGYSQMHMQQPPPTVSQLPAGRKAFTVNNKEYERLGILGRGGSSKVYSVLCPTKPTVMALKRVALERCDQETITNYMNEVALLNRLRGHDRIIQLMECQVIRSGSGRPKTLQMLMECGETDFSSLLDEQRGKPLNMNFVALYWQQMLEAVQAVHEQKVVHSDLKPANFVLVKGRLKIIDFGIAKAIANDTVNIQRDVQIGTVNYMSPEAVHKMKGQSVYKLSYPSDVWSLGCILYQMIYGNPPFHGIAGGAMIKMQVIGSGQHVIDFPERVTSKITDPQEGRVINTQQISIPYSARHTMRSCLSYGKEDRLAIPELLAHNFLKSGQDSVPELSDDQILMTQSQMRRLVDHVLRESQAGNDVGTWRQEVTSVSQHAVCRSVTANHGLVYLLQLMFTELRSQYETAFGRRSD